MDERRYQADCDLVIEMEDAGVGVEEILQYAHGILTDVEVRQLIRGLEGILKGSAEIRSSPASDTANGIDESHRLETYPPCSVFAAR
jgi:hypothetical protein